MNAIFYEYLSQFIPTENILRKEPMSRHTTFQIGGEAEVFVKVQTLDQLKKLVPYLNKAEIPHFILGSGSNLLVCDKGFRGVVIQLGEEFSKIEVAGDAIIAQSGASLSKVANVAMKNSLTGLEFAAGIPGSVGGGIVMNAGAYGGEMKQVVELVRVMDREGSILELDKDFMQFGYRSSVIRNRPFWVLDVRFVLQKGKQEEIMAKMQDLAVRRKEKQPLEYPSAGSTFKRPEGHYAGKLIADAGLSGYTVGGAQVSQKHNGFIINIGDAKAEDVVQLIRNIRETVKTKFHVDLEPEIVYLGEKGKKELE